MNTLKKLRLISSCQLSHLKQFNMRRLSSKITTVFLLISFLAGILAPATINAQSSYVEFHHDLNMTVNYYIDNTRSIDHSYSNYNNSLRALYSATYTCVLK